MKNPEFTDYNILAREEDGRTTYKVVGLKRVFTETEVYEDFIDRFESLEHVANKVMETLDINRAPRLHSTLLVYTENVKEEYIAKNGSLQSRETIKEFKTHLPCKLQGYLNDRFPGSNVTTIDKGDKLVGYRTINSELPHLVATLNEALKARKQGHKYDAVLHKAMRDSEPPISF